MLRYTTEKDKAYRILDLTSLSIDEFEQLVEPFEQAFVRHMQQWKQGTFLFPLGVVRDDLPYPVQFFF